jgi:rhodanese-related sulfurtransferase
VRNDLIARHELALIDLRDEATYALDHPLFATQISLDRLAVEMPARVPRRTCPVVLYDDGEGLVEPATGLLDRLGYRNVYGLAGGLDGWRQAGLELFQDVNSYSKAFGELVEHRRQTPSLSAQEVQGLRERGEPMVVLDARPFDEYTTMAIPGGVNVPGAELVLRARSLAPDPATRIIVNCAGRTRSLIGTQSLINARLPNPIAALRNGTIGWLLAGQELVHGMTDRFDDVPETIMAAAREDARDVAYRAGVRLITAELLTELAQEAERTLYQFDVRTRDEYLAGHPSSFRHVPGGQLVQEIDMHAPVRGARIVLADDLGVRADMTASWLAQMGWDAYVLDGGFDGLLERGEPNKLAPRAREGRYKRPYEGTDNPAAAMQAYLDWEYGLVQQLARDATHGFFVI